MTRARYFILVLVLALAACESGGPATAEADRNWTLSAAPLASVGQVDGPEHLIFQSVASGRLLPDGGFAVADGGLAAIRIYGDDGAFRTGFGREGSGPGEFQGLRDIWLTAGGDIGVWDSRQQRVTVLSPAGEVVSMATARRSADSPTGGTLDAFLGAFDDGAVALAWLTAMGSEANEIAPDRMLAGVFDAEGSFRHNILEFEGLRRFNRSPLPFSPYPHSAVHADSLHLLSDTTAAVTIRPRSGGQGRELQLPAVPHDAGAAWDTLPALLEETEDQFGLERIDEVPRTDPVPHYGGLLIDDGGRIWAKPYEPATDAVWLGGGANLKGGTWWIFDRDGARVGSIEVPESVEILDVRDDRLLGLTTDELGVERVVVYGIERG